MKIIDLLIGKRVIIETNMKVMVELEIKAVSENKHSEELEPATRENDWWPKSNDWIDYTVEFTNGSKKVYKSLNDINFF